MVDHGSRSNRAARTERGYDAVASDYAGKTAKRSGPAEEFFVRFLDLLGPRSAVVDLGCGPGQDLKTLADQGHRGLGLDRSLEMLKLAINHGPTMRADLMTLPLAVSSTNAIWSFASLLHIDSADLMKTLTEWNRVLCPGGIVGLATSLGGDQGWEEAPAAKAKVPDMPIDEQRWFVHHTEDKLRSAIGSCGWEVLEVSTRPSHRDWLQVLARKPAGSSEGPAPK